jgi:hypothetical protein
MPDADAYLCIAGRRVMEMMKRNETKNGCGRTRGIVAVQVAVMLVVMLGFAALTVDVGTLYNVRADLQRSADAAALAGASALTSDAMMRVRMDPQDYESLYRTMGFIHDRSHAYSEHNKAFGETTRIEQGDIVPGWLDLTSGTDGIQVGPAPDDYNAVEVTIRRRRNGGGVNSSVPYFFAPIFGKAEGKSSARAVAVFDDRVAGFTVSSTSAGFLPFTIHEDAFTQELAHGGDRYSFDHPNGLVQNNPDGIREVRLYPYPLSGSGYTEGDGNFGVLNIGTGNQGLQALRNQIINGVSPEDLVMEVGTSDLTFQDSGGSPVTYDITGSPGLDGGLADAIQSVEGQVVGFFLHDNVILSGSNATYRIVQVRFGRVMDIRLTGPPHQRGLFIQPVSYSGSGVKLDPDAPSSGGLMGLVVLAR